jgi:hypothetical protein
MEEVATLDASVTGVEVAGLFDPAVTESLDPQERLLLSTLLSAEDRVDIAIPENLEPDKLWDVLALCCKVFIRVRRAQSQLKFLIGRALVLIQSTPEIYTQRGFTSFDRFMSDEVAGLPAITGISRSELYKSKSVTEAFPTASLADSRDIGFTKMGLIAQVTTGANSDSAEWMEKAKSMTIPELKKEIYASSLQIPEGSLDVDVLQLTVSKEVKDRVEGFVADPLIQAYCGNRNAGNILMRAIEEVEIEWKQGAVTDDDWNDLTK